MKKPDTIKVRLTIDELMELIRYHREFYESIPKELYDRMTMAKHTLGATAKKQRNRMVELEAMLEKKWPK